VHLFTVPVTRVERWRLNLMRDPMIGNPVHGEGPVGAYDYDLGEFVLRYILVPEHRHILIMTLRRAEEDTPTLRGRLLASRKLLVDIVAIWSGLKWW
jgi:hypothetical protein